MRTVKQSGESLYKEKGSKFIGLSYAVSNISEVTKALDEIKRRYPDARHVCYAYILGKEGQDYRANDDGEPSGSAGQPILRQLHSFDVTDTLVAVVRYFGGTKLGVGGLITAYKTAARESLENATLTERVEWQSFNLKVSYESIGQLQQLINKVGMTPLETQSHEDGMTMHFRIPRTEFEHLLPQLKKLGTLDND